MLQLQSQQISCKLLLLSRNKSLTNCRYRKGLENYSVSDSTARIKNDQGTSLSSKAAITLH